MFALSFVHIASDKRSPMLANLLGYAYESFPENVAFWTEISRVICYSIFAAVNILSPYL